MASILDVKPDFAEVITWVSCETKILQAILLNDLSRQNDGCESHDVGNLWTGSYDTAQDILAYANDAQWPHKAWQPLITSFISAFKDGKSAGEMTSPSGDPIGSLWYRGMLKDACTNAPQNVQSAVDTVNCAVVLPSGVGMKPRVSIDGNVLTTVDATPGLNYAAVPGLAMGTPKLEVLSSDGSVGWAAVGNRAVDDGTVECNFNLNVAGVLKA